MLRVSVNLFWAAFVADGFLSLVDGLSPLDGGSSWLSLARSALSFCVLLASLFMAGAIALTPRAPKRLLAPAILFIWWAGPASAFPLGYWKVPHLDLWVAGAQILLGWGLFAAFRVREGERWYLPFRSNGDRPKLQWKYSLIAAPSVLAAAIVFAGISLVCGLATEIETISGGYVRIRLDGVYLVERQFQSGQQEVRLTGMMHIAEDDFYSAILPKADPEIPSVVLVEGVTDNQGLLNRGALRYSRVARMLNVTSQDESEFTEHVMDGLRKEKERAREKPGQTKIVKAEMPEEPAAVEAAAPVEKPVPPKKHRHAAESDIESGIVDFRHADVDIETFHPTTIAFLVTVVSVMQSEDLRTAIETLSDPSSPLGDENAQSQVMQDILYSRNERLVSEIRDSMKKYRRIIVPWGALHLPEIESWLRAQHFEQKGEVERKALGFW